MQGKRIGESTIGIIGFGRVGSSVAKMLSVFNPKQILVNDVKDMTAEINSLKEKYNLNITNASKEEIYNNADIITLHIPLTAHTKYMINNEAMGMMNPRAFLVNTSRGGIVNEDDIYEVLKNKQIGGCATDVFETEPYIGPLIELDNVILTQHMGSCSYDCRSRMEIEATEEVIRFFSNEPLKSEVPEEEYECQLLS